MSEFDSYEFSSYMDSLLDRKRNRKRFKRLSLTDTTSVVVREDGVVVHYRYAEQETNIMKETHEDVWVLVEEVKGENESLIAQQYHCFVSSSHALLYSKFSIITRSGGKIRSQFGISQEIVNATYDRVVQDVTTLEVSLDRRIKKEFKQTILNLPAFRLMYATGLIC